MSRLGFVGKHIYRNMDWEDLKVFMFLEGTTTNDNSYCHGHMSLKQIMYYTFYIDWTMFVRPFAWLPEIQPFANNKLLLVTIEILTSWVYHLNSTPTIIYYLMNKILDYSLSSFWYRLTLLTVRNSKSFIVKNPLCTHADIWPGRSLLFGYIWSVLRKKSQREIYLHNLFYISNFNYLVIVFKGVL